jgi:4-coumarate--CoA ligase (photoactive yellow protein activation family)
MTATLAVDQAVPQEQNLRPKIGIEAARRLCIDLISAEQDRLIRDRRLSRRLHIDGHLHRARHGALDRLQIDEDALGFDSLSLLDLVGSVTSYFCLRDSGAEDLLLVHRELGQWASVVVSHLKKMGADARMGFETSGSTGAAKRVVHRFGDLDDEVDEIREHILGPALSSARVLSTVPPRHIYGFLWSVLLTEHAGIDTLELHRAAEGAVSRLSRRGDIVLGTPFTWERAARAGERVAPGVTGICSAGPSSPATWQAARKLGLERLVEIYGSTETGGLGWRTAWDQPFSLSARALRDGDDLRRRACGSILPVQDHLLWIDDTRFTVAGRRDSVVQVAGTNVATDDVRRCLQTVEGVADAMVRLDGDRIKALVVPVEGAADTEALEDRLRVHASLRLSAAARPDRYSFAASLPLTELGKPADW